MFQSLGDEDKTTLSEHVFFVIQPEFDFSAQITGVVRVTADKADNLIKIMCVSWRTFRLCGFPVPRTNYAGSPFDNKIFQPQYACCSFGILISPFLLLLWEFEVGKDVFLVF
jgi:hypothetical protein